MNWYKIFYWITVADNAILFFQWLAGLGLAAVILMAIIRGVCSDEKWWDKSNQDMKKFRAWYARTWFLSAIISLIGWFGVIFTPSKADCIFIIASGSTAQFLTTDSSAKSIPADITKFIHQYLVKHTENLSDDDKRQLGLQSPKEKLLDKVKKMSKDELVDYLSKDDSITVK